MSVVVDLLQVLGFGAIAVGWWLLLTDAWRGLRNARARREGRR